jgi:hypothetical protein
MVTSSLKGFVKFVSSLLFSSIHSDVLDSQISPVSSGFLRGSSKIMADFVLPCERFNLQTFISLQF